MPPYGGVSDSKEADVDGLVRRVVAGVAAGMAGTLAMDLLWWSRYRRGGGEDGFTDWEFSASTTSFEEAGPPAQVGRRAAALVGVDLPDELAGTTTNVVHWLTGVGYGLAHAAVSDGGRSLRSGLATGAGAFANSYATLGALGLYQPIWEYDGQTLAKDFSAHLLFGVAAGLTHGAIARAAE